MSKLDTIKNLIARATNKEASEEEKRTCALIACKMIAESGYIIVERMKDKVENTFSSPDSGEIPDFEGANFEEVQPFVLRVSTKEYQCIKCHSLIPKGVPFARNAQKMKSDIDVTHYDCRRYFLGDT